PQTWDDKMAAALPQHATFFDSIRTDAFINHNLVANYVEFWTAQQVDKAQDKWRVMHYVILDLDHEDGKFKSEVISKNDVSFPEAVYHIAKFESMAREMPAYKPAELTEAKYPADKFPELK